MTDFKEVKTVHTDPSKKGRNTTFKVTQIIWLLLGILETVLALRFLFKLVGVNPANSFASFIYGLTNIFVAPFANLTATPSAEGMVFEFSTLIAMLVYALVFYGLERLVYVVFYRPHGDAVSVKQTTVTAHEPEETHTTTQVSKTTTTDSSDTQPTNLG